MALSFRSRTDRPVGRKSALDGAGRRPGRLSQPDAEEKMEGVATSRRSLREQASQAAEPGKLLTTREVAV